jgi:PTH1 family peptidyl-tRNA hydrolase
MYLVVGLGNPGKKYEKNRHNVGFMAVDELRASLVMPDYKEKFGGVWSKGDGAAILKPMTFMNLSGDSIQPCAAFLKVLPADLIVVHDELDLPFGDVRLKQGGGHAGHNGLRSTIERLGSSDFVRVRIGISRPPPGFRGEVADYVLSDFDPVEKAELPDVLARALAAAKRVLAEGPQAAMTVVNQKAPAFKGDAVLKGEFKPVSLEDYKGKWLVFFFYPLYRLFYNSSEPPPTPYLTSRPSLQDLLQVAGKKGPEARFLRKLSSLWSHMGDLEHQVLLDVAGRLATRADEAAKQEGLRVPPGRKCRTTRMRLVPARGKHYRKQSQTADAKPTEGAAARDLKSFPHPILDGA